MMEGNTQQMTVVMFQNTFGILRYSGGREWGERKEERWKESVAI